MNTRIDSKSSVTALEIANALAIYFAERAGGEFKNKYITFSETPQLVNLGEKTTLKDKIGIALQHNECANTNIEKVFDLILDTAKRTHMSQSDMPKNILIISDMEFDICATCGTNTVDRWGWCTSFNHPDNRLFEQIKQRYARAGYKLPRLVFWNVNSRTGTIPVRSNELGVALVSGFSTNVVKMVMSGKTDPYECLVETLMDKRYNAVSNALNN